jgi:UDP-N-acetylglucosamine:LPS N-acetylglucosamine transferase
MAKRVLIVSASMGAGHNGAAREMAQRLSDGGHEATVVDFLDCLPFGIGTLMPVLYELQLRLAPWAYEATYRLWYLLPMACAPLVAFVSLFSHRRLLRAVRDSRAEAVVSMYPLASLTLGRLRQRGKLRAPVATFITDFAVHPLWVHRAVDLHLCVHPQSAERAAKATGRPAAAPGPLVPPRFRTGVGDRDAVRARLGLSPADRAALVVAGSWGIGELEETFDDLVATGRYTPVVVCGNNDRLRRRLEARGAGVVLGWTDEMPSLLGAADVLVQNAGGLTCMEAFACGLPIVSYRPIAGHGRDNAADMERAGVAGYAHTRDELAPTLDRATTLAGRRWADLGRAMFAADPADAALLLAGQQPGPALSPVLAPALSAAAGAAAAAPLPRAAATAGPGPRRPRPLPQRVAIVGLGALAMYGGLNVGADAATALGIGVAHGARHSDDAYVAVRLGPTALSDTTLPQVLARAQVTAIVDGELATHQPGAVRRLYQAGVEVANGGSGEPRLLHVLWAENDVAESTRAIRLAAGAAPRVFAPAQRVNGFDMAWARMAHERIVRPLHQFVGDRMPQRLHRGGIYILDGRTTNGAGVQRSLSSFMVALRNAHLAPAPLAALH